MNRNVFFAWWRRFIRYRVVRLYLNAGITFYREGQLAAARALTFSLLFAVVPILAIAFAIAKGFGLDNMLEQQIRTAFATQPEVTTFLLNFVHNYLMRTQGGIFLGLGIFLLLWTLFSLAGEIEGTFNKIWKVKQDRTIYRKVTEYTSLFFLLPVLLISSSGFSIFLTSFVEKLPDVFFLHNSLLKCLQLVPYLIMVCFCTGLYFFIPNTKVKWKSAFFAGLPVGLALQALQYVYIHSQLYLSGYNAIYGSFAALPMLMIWLQFSWYIVLFGATLSYLHQNREALDVPLMQSACRKDRDELCLQLLCVVYKAFERGEAPISVDRIAEDLKLNPSLLKEALELMQSLPFLLYLDQERYAPARDPRQLTIGEVIKALDRDGRALHFKQLNQAFSAYRIKIFEQEAAKCLVVDYLTL